jgi:hypothetical protein
LLSLIGHSYSSHSRRGAIVLRSLYSPASTKGGIRWNPHVCASCFQL